MMRNLARRWPLVTAMLVIGAAGGVDIAVKQPTIYRAETRLAVGTSDLSAQAVPGFAAASQEVAANYARYVTAHPALDDLRPAVAAKVVQSSQTIASRTASGVG